MDDLLKEITERKDFTAEAWQEIRSEAALDMKNVSGNPWDENDEKARKHRPTIAPEEMGQYFNQVINQLWANPRGMQFAAVGNGASEAGARFYQNKAREIEYRSHAKIAYVTAATDAIQRSYGFVRVLAKYAGPRSANQELWIEAVPDPDMVSMDPEAKRADSSDAQFCFVEEWRDIPEFKRSFKSAKVANVSEWASTHPSWVSGNKVLVAEYWTITTRKRKLVLVQPPAPMQPNYLAPSPTPNSQPAQMFLDEVPPGAKVLRDLREVDYPSVKMYLTNGLEVLHEQDWPGKYIPIVSCYGKVLYVPQGGQTKRMILSMTRFGRAPWKALCYAASQQLEVLSMIPKVPLGAYKGQFDLKGKADVQKSMHEPMALLEYNATSAETGQQLLPPPTRVDYPAGEHLQSLELVKEGFRRSIQSAMGSNFLPTQAQRRNEKSGVALDKMAQAATTGTFHFVNNYEDMIRQVGVVVEDLIDKYYDFAGETSVIEADGTTSKTVPINTDAKDAVDTKGDYLVTVSSGPSSDSEREEVREFTDSLVQNLAIVAQVSGPKPAAAVLARSIRLRNGGPEMDALADLIEPPEYRKKDGDQAPDPEKLAMQGQMQQLQQQLQEAMKAIETDQIKMQGQKEIKEMDLAFQREKLDVDSHVKIDVAQIGAKVERLTLWMEAQQQIKDHMHEAQMASGDAKHELGMAVAAAQHQAAAGDRQHQQGLEAGDVAHEQDMEADEMGHQYALEQQATQPQPEAGV